ncbi:hypothetical protein BCR15_07155 [Tessaracoccus lapidicaptus]|uniref:Uncharacterized protein n=1 Tax=Tessaracoccus lapidicaptus TaxID=1427523 RepID=A0A1C0AKI2_9ACTN|nr:hypothetical protein BKM78_13925 [Tessaracoccus sp. T2.5-30]OCL33048.1 hypothetical protein BCR15_07155 [Tessaracoccus lapidicaptus]
MGSTLGSGSGAGLGSTLGGGASSDPGCGARGDTVALGTAEGASPAGAHAPVARATATARLVTILRAVGRADMVTSQ